MRTVQQSGTTDADTPIAIRKPPRSKVILNWVGDWEIETCGRITEAAKA